LNDRAPQLIFFNFQTAISVIDQVDEVKQMRAKLHKPDFCY